MDNIAQILQGEVPRSIGAARANLPQRDAVHPSPPDWRDEVLYFLLPDRFSDGQEHTRPLLDRTRLGAQRAAYAAANGLPEWRWDMWKQSGEGRFQGGTLAGITSQLPYLADLGVTTLWIAPVFRQRVEGNDFHGYGVQDFLGVDSRFGTRADLVELVRAAHAIHMRVVLDIIFNHTGSNWFYDAAETGDAFRPKYTANTGACSPRTASVARSRIRSSHSATTTTSGPRTCNSSRTTRVRGREASVPGTSVTPMPNTNALTSRCYATWPWNALTRSRD
jgi:hypothetical protein